MENFVTTQEQYTTLCDDNPLYADVYAYLDIS